eukprot:CAMPEP_0197039212 /NCGR_PEP_ID=MMETSP1384-20130603/16036_1 /TAXON_ID=29189 /ORGANISM="Ammonia sp." /LENGTH=238 /DNA_ID=CAMNT_0042469767 /DNA_START=248 /DNA_END=960 /DNA_ORIENTATION=+
MKLKEIPQQREIVRTLSSLTTSTTATLPPTQERAFEPARERRVTPKHSHRPKINHSRLPIQGDIVEISYVEGRQNDPVHIYSVDYDGAVQMRYSDDQGATNQLNLFHSPGVYWQITSSVYATLKDEFIPAPRIGDRVKMMWKDNGGYDVGHVKNVQAEYTEEYLTQKQTQNQEEDDSASVEFKANEEEPKKNINHYNKFKHIWITVEYDLDGETETVDFLPQAEHQELRSWRTMQCSR